MDWTTILVAVITTLGVGGVGALGKWIIDLRKAPAEANRTDAEAENLSAQALASVSNSAKALLDPLVRQVERQAKDLDRLSDRLQRAEEKAERLDDEVHDLRRERELHRSLLLEHVAADQLMLTRLKDAGIDVSDLEPLPPLVLPHH